MEWVAAGLFSLLIGAVGFWTAVRHLKSGSELNQWKTTSGRVIERGVFQPDAPSLGPPAFQHAPLVRYSYSVDGKEFVGNCVFPSRLQVPPRSTRKWAQKKAASFPDEVVVHYNAANPDEAYLIQTSRGMLVTVAVVGVLMILFGLVILLTTVVA